jgi:hypothetical protein
MAVAAPVAAAVFMGVIALVERRYDRAPKRLDKKLPAE